MSEVLIAYSKTFPAYANNGQAQQPNIHYVLKTFIAVAGQKQVRHLNALDVRTVAMSYSLLSPVTRYVRASALRRICRYLRAECQAPDLVRSVPRQSKAAPRNVTATEDERATLLAAAPMHLRCWLLLCSDLAMRSGTAARIRPTQYDAQAGTVTFRTKYDEALTLPVTVELQQLFALAPEPRVPYVAQLNPKGQLNTRTLRGQFRDLKKLVGVRPELKPHDLRRTTAMKIYDLTGDLRLVQAVLGHRDLNATLHYIDHRNRAVPRQTLELAKMNVHTETVQ